jgi:pimeloyl-ACP methyl ester carboxylesterase
MHQNAPLVLAVPVLQKASLPDAGHMLHHDQPVLLAELLENFLQN